MSSVSLRAISVLIDALSVDVGTLIHVTATSSLEKVQRQAGINAISIAKLLDIAILSSDIVADPVPVSLYPSTGLPEVEHEEQRRDWQKNVRNIKMSQPVLDGMAFRKVVEQANFDAKTKKLVLDSYKTILKSLSWAASAGFKPNDFMPSDDFEIALKDVWEKVDSNIFAAKVRSALWAKDASDKLSLVKILTHLTGSKSQAFNIFLHGFYFYTPAQWRFFHLLNSIPGVNVHAIVHDDGEGESFRVWREFFTERFGFSFPGKVKSVEKRQTPALIFLNDVLGNKRPDFVPAGIEVVECNSPAEFTRDYFQLSDELKAQKDLSVALYAADEKSISKYIHRLGRDTQSVEANLLQMPVGAFLIALHNCLKRNARRELSLQISLDDMGTMLSSGFVPSIAADSAGLELVEKIPEIIQFFQGCEDAFDWETRALNLERLVLSDLSAFPSGLGGMSVRDRNAIIVENPLLLLPWANLSHHQVALLREGILEVVALARKILESADAEGTTIHRHVSNLVSELAYGLQNVPDSERELIEQKFNVSGLDNETAMDVDALVEIVDMILQRKTEFEIDELAEDFDSDSSKALPLRALDVFGFEKSPRPIVISNLSDQVFPQQPAIWPWPFSPVSLSQKPDSEGGVTSSEIVQARSRTASLADIYLLSLAFSVADKDNRVRLSWISDVAGTKQELSPIVRLIAAPESGAPSALKESIVGVPITQVLSASEVEGQLSAIADELPDVGQFELQPILDEFGLVPVSSMHVCKRRFALQWAFGEPQFLAEHMQANLHGHLHGWLQVVSGLPARKALRMVEDFWRHLSSVLRSGSRAMNFIRLGKARPVQLFTGKGSASRQGTFDIAYQHAMGRRKPIDGIWSSSSFQFLPPGSDETDACQMCPINKNCSVRIIK